MKRIVTLAATAAVVAASFVVVPYAAAHSTATTVKVTAKEWKFVLSRHRAPHGKVVFKVVNKGKFSHDFKIAGKKTKLLKHGQSAKLTVTLKKGKKYTYICTVPGHAQLGMKGTFKAT